MWAPGQALLAADYRSTGQAGKHFWLLQACPGSAHPPGGLGPPPVFYAVLPLTTPAWSTGFELFSCARNGDGNRLGDTAVSWSFLAALFRHQAGITTPSEHTGPIVCWTADFEPFLFSFTSPRRCVHAFSDITYAPNGQTMRYAADSHYSPPNSWTRFRSGISLGTGTGYVPPGRGWRDLLPQFLEDIFLPLHPPILTQTGGVLLAPEVCPLWTGAGGWFTGGHCPAVPLIPGCHCHSFTVQA